MSEITAETVARWNAETPLFTAGPASLAYENLAGLRPCFGRGDAAYLASSQRVLEHICALAGQEKTVAMQGSGTSAIEVMIANFLQGDVLVVKSGYYSDRLEAIARARAARDGFIRRVDCVNWGQIAEATGRYDWVLSVYTETSEATLVPVQDVAALAKRCGARLALDATASIGLEADHDLADVCAFSSCKGLFGLTGAGFVAHSVAPQNGGLDMISDLATYAEKKTTGPYHALLSLEPILERHADHREAVVACKRDFCARFADHLMSPEAQQPLLCTALGVPLRARHPGAVLYAPRQTKAASITCHLGEVHLGRGALGEINAMLEVAE